MLSILLMLSVGKAFASVVDLEASVKRYDLGTHVEYFEDESGDVDISDLIADQNALQWQQSTMATPNFAFSESVYWMRLAFKSKLSEQQTWLFEIAFPLQDYIDFYVVDGGEVLKKVATGDRRVFSTREIDYRNFLFELDVPAGSERQVYIRLDTADGLHEPSPLILWQEREFALQNGIRNLGLGLYFGIMVVMALYNLFLYASIRDKTYFYYVAYILGFSFWLFSYYGFSYQYFWPDSPVLGNQSTIILTSFWAIFVTLFVCSFLDSARRLPWFDKLMKVYIACMVFTILSSVGGNYSLGIFLVIGVGIPAAFSGILAGIQSLRSGYGPARFFLLAWFVLLLSLIIFCLKIWGLLPPVWVIERSVQIGSAIEVVVLSLGLANRINTLEKEKIAAQNQAIKSFESSMKLKNDFITSISHELRTPMNAIIGGVEMARNGGSDAEESLRVIRSGANDMMRLVNDILVHTELQSGQLSLKAESASVKTALRRLKEYYGPLCKEQGLSFAIELDSSIPDWIMVDAHKLTVILTKLLDNAVKFTDEGGVTLTVARESNAHGEFITCSVADTGPGIAKESQALIFDPFVQVEGGFTRRHSGMGIGLSICRRLAEMLGGQLTLDSTVGNGSCFTLRIPLKEGNPVHRHSSGGLALPHWPALVVEDNRVNQKVMVKMLEKLGFTAVVANHGREALDLLAEQRFAFVLMDLQMPVMDGFCCTEKIRHSAAPYADIPIIAVTANVMDQDKTRCFNLGMNDFLEKPLKLSVLQESLSQFIEIKPPEKGESSPP